MRIFYRKVNWPIVLLFALAIGALLVSLFLPGCLTPRFELDTSNVAPAATIVMTRVEHYAAADSAMAGPDRAAALADVASARMLLGQPKVDQRLLAPPLERLCDRHDAWVLADTLLEPMARTIYLETTTQLRAVLRPPN